MAGPGRRRSPAVGPADRRPSLLRCHPGQVQDPLGGERPGVLVDDAAGGEPAADDEVAACSNRGAHAGGLGIKAVGDQDIARCGLVPGQAFGAAGTGQDQLVKPLRRDVEAGVQMVAPAVAAACPTVPLTAGSMVARRLA